MQDMKTLTQILYPEGHDGCSSSEGTTGTDTLRVAHPLHREDPLYDAQDAQEQVRILAERTAQQKAQQASKTTSSNTGKQRAASRLTRVVEARIDRGSQQAAARSHTPVIAAVHSSRSPYKAGRSSRSSGILDHNVPQSNGNSSSRQSCASTTAANGNSAFHLPLFCFLTVYTCNQFVQARLRQRERLSVLLILPVLRAPQLR